MAASAGEKIYLFEAKGVNPTTLAVQTFGFASGRGYNDPSSPIGVYVPVLKQPANIERHAFPVGQTYGTSQAPFSFGPVEIINEGQPDLLGIGTFDFLLDYGFDGQTGRLLLIDPTQNYSTAQVILTGTLEQVVDDGKGTMSFIFRDATLALDQPFQPNLFAGTNSGATGVEGTSSDLKNKPKPYGFGQILNASPAPANAVSLVYQLSYRQISAITNVYDKGALLTAGVAQGSLAALLAGTPAASHYDYYLGSSTDGAYIKLGSNPTGAITCDFNGDANGGYASTHADIWKRILLLAIPGATINAADITALNAAQPAPMELFIDSDTTFRSVLDMIAASAGCYYNIDASGTWRIRRLEDPASGTAVCNITPFVSGSVVTVSTDCDIIDIQKDKQNDPQSNDPNNGVPVWNVNINWGKNWTVQAAGELAGNSAARAAFTSLEFRSVVAQDSGTSTSTLTVGAGTQTVTIAEGQANWDTGQLVSLHTADNSKVMIGTVTTWAAPTLTLSITAATGSGSASAWIVDGTKALHALARIISFDTLFSVQADGAAEAQRLLKLYRVRRDFITVHVQLEDAATVSLIDLGSVVNLKFGRWGYASGKKMLVTGIIYDAAANIMILNLWG